MDNEDLRPSNEQLAELKRHRNLLVKRQDDINRLELTGTDVSGLRRDNKDAIDKIDKILAVYDTAKL